MQKGSGPDHDSVFHIARLHGIRLLMVILSVGQALQRLLLQRILEARLAREYAETYFVDLEDIRLPSHKSLSPVACLAGQERL